MKVFSCCELHSQQQARSIPGCPHAWLPFLFPTRSYLRCCLCSHVGICYHMFCAHAGFCYHGSRKKMHVENSCLEAVSPNGLGQLLHPFEYILGDQSGQIEGKRLLNIWNRCKRALVARRVVMCQEFHFSKGLAGSDWRLILSRILFPTLASQLLLREFGRVSLQHPLGGNGRHVQ